MRRWMGWLIAAILLLGVNASYAQTVSLTADPIALKLSGRVDSDTISASVRLIAGEELTDVQIQVSDLVDATGDGRARDPISASAATVLPQTEFESLTPARPTQVVVQISPPEVSGLYTGTLSVYWAGPTPGELSIPLVVEVRTRPTLIVHSPAQLALRGVKGKDAVASLTLRETAGGTALTGLQVQPQDLHTADSHNVLPADHIAVTLPADRIPGGGLLAAAVTVNLRGVPAGDYSGQVLLTSTEGDLVSLPVSVSVRHPAWPAILLLLFGAGLGLGVKAYQAEGKTRDDLIARLAAVRHELNADADLHDLFGAGLNPLIVKGEALVRRKQWKPAGQVTEDAEALLLKWQGAREGWVAQLRYLEDRLLPRLEGDAVTRKSLLHQTQTIQSDVAALNSPSELKDRLFDIEGRVARFETLENRIAAIGEVRVQAAGLGAAALGKLSEQWIKQQQALENRLNWLAPDDADGWTRLETDIQALGETMAAEIEKTREMQAAAGMDANDPFATTRGEAKGSPVAALLSRLRDSLKMAVSIAAPPGQIGAFTLEMGQAAQRRRQIFAWFTYLLGSLFLAGAGFATLYLAKPAFGADLVGDYLSLLAWGLGGQTSLTALIDVIQGWSTVLGAKADE